MNLRIAKWLLLTALLLPLAAKAQISGVGNIGCPGQTVTGTVANSGTLNNTVLLTVSGTPCPAVLVQLDQTSTLTAGAITFNLSNDSGANYVAVPVAQVINQSTFAQLTNPYTLVPSTNQAFLILLDGATYFQVKLTTVISGSGSVTPYVTPVGLPPALSLNSSGLGKIDASGATVPVSGTFWQSTQPVSLASLPSLVAGSANIGGVEVIDSGGTNKLGVNASGQIAISNFPATQTVSGTVTANAGTGTFNIQSNASVNVNQVAGTALGATAVVNYGSTPAAAAVPGVNAFVTNTPTVEPGNTANTTPWLVNLNDGTHSLAAAISAYGTAPTGTEVLGVNAYVTNSPTVTANAGTGTFTVGQATGTNLHVVCDSGCGGASSFDDNAAFTAGTTPVNITAGWYSTSITNCTSGSACAPQLTVDRTLMVTARMQAYNGSSWVNATSWAADNSAFTAGTTPGATIAGWYASSPTACTSGNLCVPSLTSDRKLFVQDFQGTSPWVVSASGNFGVTQQTSPWVDNLSQIAGTALGATAIVNYGSTPAAVAVPAVNAFVTNTPTVEPGNTANTTPWLVNLNDGTHSLTAAISAWGSAPTGTEVLGVNANVLALPANASVNLNQEAGTAITNTPTAIGTKGSGNVMSVNADLTSIAGTATATGDGTSGAGDLRVNIASDNSVLPAVGAGATGSAVPANAVAIAGNGNGNLTGYVNCDKSAVYDNTTNGATQLVALSSGHAIYVCGFQFSTSQSTAVHVALEQATAASCGGTTTKITPNYPLQAAASTGPIGLVMMTPGYTGLAAASGDALCILTDAAVSVQALVFYSQF
jgi:hypothetical protein